MGSLVYIFAPVSLATISSCSPIGPQPAISTDSPATNAGFLHGLGDGVDGLDEGSFLEGHIIGQSHYPPLRHPRHGFYVLARSRRRWG